MNRKPGYGAQLRANLEPTKGVGRLRQQDGALMRELRKGIRLKFRNRNVAVDGNVRESGDVGRNSGKSYLFCLTACPPWKRLSRSCPKSVHGSVHGKGQHADMCTDMVHQLSKISTRTVHGKGQHADMYGQHADMSSVHGSVHGSGQHADMCTDMVHQLSKISTRTVHGKGQHADMCGQHADMSSVHGSVRGSVHGQSTGRASMLICVYTDQYTDQYTDSPREGPAC
ncbi:unnamed protein product [Brassica rapa]|uniref:Uncharacterized protein n=1 Tax=Brassica campestris TaxID=3711 RepID=A0A8D9CTD8_BRACM|nr:unnamed protein product [Brassica rapa]